TPRKLAMITVTTMRRREIGLMKALGARIDQIIGVFMGQGFAVGAIGAVAGVLAAFVFLYFRQFFLKWVGDLSGIEIFSADVYHFYELPAKLTTVDIAFITGAAFLACAFSSLLPAYFAARMDAAKALRNESG
ncbi:MAG: FtsX-like permease family protein, partial [Verrucomicrobiota bacterium]